MAMLQCLRGLRDDGATVHGFRASFSTWAREQTGYAHEIVEAALAHTQSNQVIAAYARTIISIEGGSCCRNGRSIV